MNKKTLLLIAFFLLIHMLPIVQADVVNDILEPFAGFDIQSTYDQYYMVIDLVLYIILFIFVAKKGLAKFAGDHKGIPTIIGVILAIGAAYFETTVDFNLADIGPLALVLVMIVIAMAVYNIMKDLGVGGASRLAWAIVLIYAFLFTIGNSIVDWADAQDNSYVSLLWGILNVIFVIAIVIIFMNLFSGSGIISKLRGEGKKDKNMPDVVRPAAEDSENETKDAIDKDNKAKVESFTLEKLEAWEMKDLQKERAFLHSLVNAIHANQASPPTLEKIGRDAEKEIKHIEEHSVKVFRNIGTHINRLIADLRKLAQDIKKDMGDNNKIKSLAAKVKYGKRVVSEQEILITLQQVEAEINDVLMQDCGGLKNNFLDLQKDIVAYRKEIKNALSYLKKTPPDAHSALQCLAAAESKMIAAETTLQKMQNIEQQVAGVANKINTQLRGLAKYYQWKT